MARSRTGTTFVAELLPNGRGMSLRPAFEAGPEVQLLKSGRGTARMGDLVTARFKGGGAEVVAVHGPSTSAGAAIRALIVHEGLGRGFTRATRDEAEAAARRDTHEPIEGARRDMRGQRVITIDPEGAKDHDDAIAVAREGDDGIRLWVHIADVSHFVREGGAIDREAERRGCSTYLPGTVDPMLPELLSNDLCSLRPGVDRKAMTAQMVVMPDGTVTGESFHRSLIRSEQRLTYPQVDALLEGRAGLGDAGLDDEVRLAMELARRLRARRMRRGALDIVTSEPRFRFEGDRIAAVEEETQTAAHSLIEECMIAANEAVARFLIAKKVPTIFRVHGDPDQQAVEELWNRLEVLGIPVPPLAEGMLTREQRREAAGVAAHATRMYAERTGHGARSLPYMVLRALQRAVYRPDETSHSGLASPAYLHFTSPIRRYPDLVVHRALAYALGLDESAAPDADMLPEVALDSSTREREATDLERRADRMCLAYLLADQVTGDAWDTPWDGEVTGIGDSGLFVAFGESFEGFMPYRRMPGDHWVPDMDGVQAIGEETGRRIRLGDAVVVRVHDIQPLRGRVTVEPADAPSTRDGRGDPGSRSDRSRPQRRGRRTGRGR